MTNKGWCRSNYHKDGKRRWGSLTNGFCCECEAQQQQPGRDEKSKITRLSATPATPEPIPATPQPTPTLRPTLRPEPTPEPIPATPEPTSPPAAESTTEFATESAATPRAEQEVISEEDAEKLRDIALIWWMEFYSERMQSLLSQMYAWKAPGTKYETAVIVQWLEGEDELVRDRINQLISLKNNNLTIEETP